MSSILIAFRLHTKKDKDILDALENAKNGEKFQLLIAPIIVRLEILLYNPRMRNILCQEGGRMNTRQWMDE